MTDFARYLTIRSAQMPLLSPDGSRVAFLSDISGNFQVWSVSTARETQEWPRQLTFFADKVWEIHGTGGAGHLLAVGDVGGNERQQFYLISSFGGDRGHDVRRLTVDDGAIHRFGGFSGDGLRILYVANPRNGVDFDLFQMDVTSGESRLLLELSGNQEVMAWSPDERFVLTRQQVGPLEDRLFLVDLLAEGGPALRQELTQGRTPARYEQVRWRADGVYLLSDRTHDRGALCRLEIATGELAEVISADSHTPEGEMEALAVASNGVAVYAYNEGGYSRLWRVELATKKLTRVEGLPDGQIGHISLQADGTIVCDVQTPQHNLDIWLVAGDGSARRLTQSDRAGLDPASFVRPEPVSFRSFDELSIPALYYLPQTPPPAAGYPCILYVHGGPTSQLRPDFDVRFQYFLSRGYAILGTNVRGSTGYGRGYAALDEIEKRPDSVADLKHAVLWLHSRPEIDSRRVAIYGRSYGGYMVLAALTSYPELFAAGIDVVGIANWVSFMERTSPWRRAHREEEYGSLARHREVLERISPIHRAEQITMPLLVIAGDNDPRVPLFESELIVEKVRANGGTVEFLHYADEGHKISKLTNRIDSFTKMAAFLDRSM
ncbi:MAG: S9 family peptidase [Caldilineaceae bacterium]|nr:S9 family peptidase [Caldilineaceae bacterium]